MEEVDLDRLKRELEAEANGEGNSRAAVRKRAGLAAFFLDWLLVCMEILKEKHPQTDLDKSSLIEALSLEQHAGKFLNLDPKSGSYLKDQGNRQRISADDCNRLMRMAGQIFFLKAIEGWTAARLATQDLHQGVQRAAQARLLKLLKKYEDGFLLMAMIHRGRPVDRPFTVEDSDVPSFLIQVERFHNDFVLFRSTLVADSRGEDLTDAQYEAAGRIEILVKVAGVPDFKRFQELVLKDTLNRQGEKPR